MSLINMKKHKTDYGYKYVCFLGIYQARILNNSLPTEYIFDLISYKTIMYPVVVSLKSTEIINISEEVYSYLNSKLW